MDASLLPILAALACPVVAVVLLRQGRTRGQVAEARLRARLQALGVPAPQPAGPAGMASRALGLSAGAPWSVPDLMLPAPMLPGPMLPAPPFGQRLPMLLSPGHGRLGAGSAHHSRLRPG